MEEGMGSGIFASRWASMKVINCRSRISWGSPPAAALVGELDEVRKFACGLAPVEWVHQGVRSAPSKGPPSSSFGGTASLSLGELPSRR
jgi:hypothetical protein